METLLTIDALEAAARQCGRKGYVRIPFVGWVSAERLAKTCQAMRDAGASVAVKRETITTRVRFYALNVNPCLPPDEKAKLVAEARAAAGAYRSPFADEWYRDVHTSKVRLAFSWNGGRGSLALIVLSEAPPVGCPVAILGASSEACDSERKATRRARGERAREMIACYAVDESEAA